MNINPEGKKIFTIILLAFLIRIICIFLFGNIHNPEMWEFGAIARNLVNGIGYKYIAVSIDVPSAHMPPGLPFIYYLLLKFFGDNSFGFFAILLTNSMLSCVSILVLYNLSLKIYNKRVALYSSIYASLSPIFLFSTISYNSIIFYHLLIALSYYYFLKISESIKADNIKTKHDIVILGIISGVFLYFRSEIFGLIIIIFLYMIFKKKFRLSLLYITIPIMIIAPWTVRNYYVFGKIIPVTTSFGYNVLMGHGGNEPALEYEQKVSTLTEDSTFEIKKSELALKIAIDCITSNPQNEIVNSLKKLFSLWVIDTYRELAKNPLYLTVWLPTLGLFITGIFFSLKNSETKIKLTFLFIYLLFSSAIVILFFNIPRYQIQMSFVMVPTSMYAIEKILSKIKSANNK